MQLSRQNSMLVT